MSADATERIVDRSELISNDGFSPARSPDVEILMDVEDFEFVKHDDQPDLHRQASVLKDDDELEFYLFAPSAGGTRNTEGTAKIRIQTPPFLQGEPGFIVPSRDRSYYLGESTKEAKERYRNAAVTGQDVLKRSTSSWPGSSYEWKVLHIPSSKRQCSMLSTSAFTFAKLVNDDVLHKRKRPGKKARIKRRTKIATTKARQDQKQKAAELKEAAEREKRTRRNREKKVKKKQRDKAKKTEVQSADSLTKPD